MGDDLVAVTVHGQDRHGDLLQVLAVTVRYARPGDVLGVAVLVGEASTSVPGGGGVSLPRISARMLTAAARTDPRVCWAIAEELNRRLYDTLEQTAVNAFGSVRQRVAAHLLDLASAQQHPRRRSGGVCRIASMIFVVMRPDIFADSPRAVAPLPGAHKQAICTCRSLNGGRNPAARNRRSAELAARRGG